MIGFTIERLEIPASLDGPGGEEFVASVEVRNAAEVRAYGSAEYAYPAEQLFPNWLDAHEPKRLWVAREGSAPGGVIIGRGVHEMLLDDASTVGWVDIDVHPDAEGRGIGRALADVAEAYARELGQSRLITYAVSPEGPGPRPEPPTGFGSVPAASRQARFLMARGYRLEQVVRASRFALPADPEDLRARRVAAEVQAGPDYAVHTWAGSTPPRWLGDIAVLMTRMSTDAPTAGLEEPEDVWDSARVAAREEIDEAGSTATLTAVAEHVPTGRLAGFTQLSVPRTLDRPVSQDDTLVLREHRGHRLGMLLKVANLQALADWPGHPAVLTWNAEENRPMLDVNEAVGFVAVGYEGAWRLDLA